MEGGRHLCGGQPEQSRSLKARPMYTMLSYDLRLAARGISS